MSREKEFDKTMTAFFDALWSNETYLGWMGHLMKANFDLRRQWNKNMENWLTLFQLPNQEMQQRTLHQLTTLFTEWRFEQEELSTRLAHLEQEITELKQLIQAALDSRAESRNS